MLDYPFDRADCLTPMPHTDLLHHDGLLSRAELVATVINLFVAGHVTTATLTNGVLALLLRPSQWQALHTDPARLGPAVEEILRYDTIAGTVPVYPLACAASLRTFPVRR
ncbi:hypothetical protein [Kitasatospora purpeofusca]|uniref:hypothetical protein n=1 Tax=Kitasatospora purpeofusca TaxID=67352 RepID=UPI0038685FCB